jgi:hypothetical protein
MDTCAGMIIRKKGLGIVFSLFLSLVLILFISVPAGAEETVSPAAEGNDASENTPEVFSNSESIESGEETGD